MIAIGKIYASVTSASKTTKLRVNIDPSLRMLVPEIAIFRCDARMKARSKNVLFSSSSQVAECFTKHDMVVLVASKASLKTANIFEVMHNFARKLNVIFITLILRLLLICQQLNLLPVADNQGYIVIFIMLESFC